VTEEIGRPERRRGQEYLPTLDTIVRSANRSNVSSIPLDPSDASTATVPDPRADACGRSRSKPMAARPLPIWRAVSSARLPTPTDYYLLTYRSAQPDDGKFRGVDVRVARPA